MKKELRHIAKILRKRPTDAEKRLMSYGDYVEQLTYLLFLKMADERSKPPYNMPSPVPKEYNWQSLLKKDSDVHTLLRLPTGLFYA